MALPESLRSFIPLVIGLVIGGVGIGLFQESLPGAQGSPEERASKLEHDLKHAQNRIAALEADLATRNGLPVATPAGVLQRITANHDHKRALSDGAREIAEDIKAGRPVSPDAVFRATQPLIRDLAPLFDRMRLREQQRITDQMVGELARKYSLQPAQQEMLKQWFERKASDDAERWTAMLSQDGTRLEDVMRAARDVRPDEGLDNFMPTLLNGDKLLKFKSERLADRAERVQHEADMKVQRLDSIVHLDENQRDQVFGIMARNSKNYDPQMALEGANGSINAYQTGLPKEAMLSVLRPDQRAAYDTELNRRRNEAQKDMEAMGLTLPANWEMFEDN